MSIDFICHSRLWTPCDRKGRGRHADQQGAPMCHTLDVYAYISNLIRATIDKGATCFPPSTCRRCTVWSISLRKTAARGYFTAGPSITTSSMPSGRPSSRGGDCGLRARCNPLHARFRRADGG